MNICRRMSTSSTKLRVVGLHVIVVQWTSKKCAKKRDARAEHVVLIIKPIDEIQQIIVFFFSFFLGGGGGGAFGSFYTSFLECFNREL